ncbi:MAG: hypothetical protein BWK73_10515 [Thiothrix lacustris]|uniref:Bacterial virulence protein VirB8 domain-containing protein n=1 Tax=Thiothrix lacustris TaxID=525917 RepID=A0A1Y1QUE2_9GAMM|nr:MAG: hypothetical protein BWK73_10515 [Thiothrix lacustris]
MNDNNKPVSNGSPYLAARNEWNERYGSYIAAARQWRMVAWLSLVVAAGAVAAVGYFASQNKLIPYIVEIDGTGEIAAVRPATQAVSADVQARMVRWQVAQFVRDWRTVSPDGQIAKAAVDRVFALLSAAYSANAAIGEWFRENNPFTRASENTVTVEIQQVLPVSEKSWRVDWIETSRPRTQGGKTETPVSWTATVTVLAGGAVSEKTLLLNPTGLVVTDVSWQQQLK